MFCFSSIDLACPWPSILNLKYRELSLVQEGCCPLERSFIMVCSIRDNVTAWLGHSGGPEIRNATYTWNAKGN